MTRKEKLVRSLLGCTTRLKLKPFLVALDVAEELMYTKEKSLEDIAITKDLYPEVAIRTGNTYYAVARAIQRTANRCIDRIEPSSLHQEIGIHTYMISAPSDLVFMLAAYLHTGKSIVDQ